MLRFVTLFLGPLAIIGLAYAMARPGAGAHGTNRALPEGPDSAAPPTVSDPNLETSKRPEASRSSERADREVVSQCQRRREALMRRLGARFSSIVHTPFVVVGDVSSDQLEEHYRRTIAPTLDALSIAYFDRPPTEPISIVLLSSDDSYQACVYELDGQRRASYAGYYQRSERRIVVNTSTGDGTIAHELTHALAHFDFPDMPEWFDEGLASLHEEARFSDDRLKIVGKPNWRSRSLQTALRQGTLRPLESLIAQARVRPEQQAIDYAHARYFCLFLQARGLLEPYYRKFRLNVAADPTGLKTLRALFHVSDLASVDEEFRAWAIKVRD